MLLFAEMNRDILFAPSEFYHLYNRGVEKRVIFTNASDYRRFLTLLFMCNSSNPVHLHNKDRINKTLIDFDRVERGNTLVDLLSYCLMPNHFHLLIREKSDTGCSKFMQKLCTAYTMYFNKKYNRVGPLFQGKFKATHVNNDRYLKYLISYIHLNPVKLIDKKWKENGISNREKAKKYLENYKFSSYLDYIGRRRIEQKIINTDILPNLFDELSTFENEVKEWLGYTNV